MPTGRPRRPECGVTSDPHGALRTDRNVIGLVLWIALCLGGGIALGIVFRPDAWFRALHHPSFAPPDAVFAPVWSILYVLMAVAMWRIESHGDTPAVGAARKVFLIQLALNFAWTPVFFGAHAIIAAMVVIVAIWIAIVATFVVFHRVERAAAYLLVPYWAWVTFAMFLNAGYVILN
jgi:translocator protein